MLSWCRYHTLSFRSKNFRFTRNGNAEKPGHTERYQAQSERNQNTNKSTSKMPTNHRNAIQEPRRIILQRIDVQESPD